VGLEPRPDVEAGRPYGLLHHVLDCPTDEQADGLALWATENRILRPFEKHR
jgi:hypothetical protein